MVLSHFYIFAFGWNTDIASPQHKVSLPKHFHTVFDMLHCSNIIHHTSHTHTVPRLTSGSILSKNWDSILWGDRKSARSWLLLSSGCCRSFCKEKHIFSFFLQWNILWRTLDRCCGFQIYYLFNPNSLTHFIKARLLFFKDLTCGFVCFYSLQTEFILLHNFFFKLSR